MPHSYYAATAKRFTPAQRLEGAAKADVVVAGGGVTGLSAARQAPRRGYKVALVEAGRLGWGASGRSGGQLIPGWRKGAAELIAAFGRERAKALFALSLEARELTLDLIRDHAIACDIKTTGHLYAAARA